MELNLEELVTGIVTAYKLVQWMDTVNYSENDMHYSLMLSHSLGPEISKTISESYQNMFKIYGIKAEITNSTKKYFCEYIQKLRKMWFKDKLYKNKISHFNYESFLKLTACIYFIYLYKN